MCNGALHVIGLYGLVTRSLSSWRIGSLRGGLVVGLMLPEKPQCHSNNSLSLTVDGL